MKKNKADLKPIEMNTPRINKMKEQLILAKTDPVLKQQFLEKEFPGRAGESSRHRDPHKCIV